VIAKGVTMRTRIVLWIALAGAARGLLAQPNLSGRWDVSMNPDFAGHRTVEHCQMIQKSQALTVRCGTAGAEMPGDVDGRNVSWRFVSRDAGVVSWEGKLDKAGRRIDGQWQFIFSDGHKMRGRFSASKNDTASSS
jgi:hypothetical protein